MSPDFMPARPPTSRPVVHRTVHAAAAMLVLAAVPACANLFRKADYYSVNPDGTRSQVYSRINEYRSYQKNVLGAQQTVAAAYEAAEHRPPPKIDVDVYNEALPPGVSVQGETVEIAANAPYEPVGRFELGYWRASAPQESQIGGDLERLASVTGSDVVVIEVQHLSHGDPRVDYLTGFLLHKTGLVGRAAAATAHVAGTSGTAAAARPRARARLAYHARGRGCLTTAEFEDEVSARLGYTPWVDAGSGTVQTTIEPSGGGFRATVRVGDAAQQLTGATCRVATDAAVSAVVLHLDALVSPPTSKI